MADHFYSNWKTQIIGYFLPFQDFPTFKYYLFKDEMNDLVCFINACWIEQLKYINYINDLVSQKSVFRFFFICCLIKFSIILPPNVPRVLIEMSKNNYRATMKYLKKHVNEVFIMLWHWHFCWIRYLRYLFHTLFRPFFLFFK